MEMILRRCARFSWRYHRVILVATVALTALCGWYTYQLFRHLDTDMAALLPEDYPSVRALEQLKEKVRGVETLLVVVEGPDTNAVQAFAEDLAQRLQVAEYQAWVKGVDYRREVEFLRRKALLYMELEDLRDVERRVGEWIDEQKLRRSPFYVALDDEDESGAEGLGDVEGRYAEQLHRRRYYTNPDGTILVLTVQAAGTTSNLGFGRGLLAAVQGAVAEVDPASYGASLTVDYGGVFKDRIDEYEAIRSDVTSTLLYGVAGVVLLLALYFRQVLAVFFVTLPLLMGLSWSFAISYVVIGKLNMITGFLFAVLFGLGIGFGIHLFARYLQLRCAGASPETAAEEMLARTGAAVLTSGLTTAAAFYSLVLTEFRGFSEFGFIVGTGTVASLATMVTVLPASLAVADRDLGLVRLRTPAGDALLGTGRLRGALAVLVAAGLLTAAAAGSLPAVGFEYDFGRLRVDLPASRAVRAKIEQVGEVERSAAALLTDTEQELSEVVAAIERKMAAPDSTPTIREVRTLATALPRDQDEKLPILARLRAALEREEPFMSDEQRQQLEGWREPLAATRVGIDDLPASMKVRFRTVDGERAHLALIYPSVSLRDGRNAMDFADDAGRVTTASGRSFYASSSSLVFADMLRVMIRDSRTAVALTAIVVLLIVWVDFRRLRLCALAVLPLAVGLVWAGGAMAVLGMKLNFYNMVVMPTLLGLGIDNGVHMVHRYLEEGQASLRQVLTSAGGAMVVCALTTMVGFGSLLSAQHAGLKTVGQLALLGLGCCLVPALTVLPALLQWMEDRKGRTA